MVGGIGRWRGLVSRGLCRLASLDSAPDNASAGSHARTSRLMAASLTSPVGLDIDEERSDVIRNSDIVKEELARGVAAP